MALRVACQQAAGLGDFYFVANRSECVLCFAGARRGMRDAVGCYEREAVRAGDIDHGLIARFFGAVVVALQLGIDVPAAEDVDETIHAAGREIEGAVIAAGEQDEAFGELCEIVRSGRTFPFG